MTAPTPAFIEGLRQAIPADALSTDPSDLAVYGRDWTKVFDPAPSAIVFPRTTEEVSRVLAMCNEAKVAVVPSGGRTGLAAGAVAARGEVVLSLARMRRMDPVDLLGSTVRVQAGAITEEVHAHCEPHGLTWPVDFASKGSSQVGGNIATNAGGVKVIRYGLTRQWVLGLQVVLASGEVLELNGALEKNNTGVDLRQLFIGSEGTLGIITEATLKLARRPASLAVLLFAVPDLAGVLALFREARRAPFTITAYEFFTDRAVARLTRHRKVRMPLDRPSGCYVLLEIEPPAPDVLEGWLGSVLERELVTDGTMAQTSTQAAELWALREGLSESLSSTGVPHKNDVSLPVASLEPFCVELDALFTARYASWEVVLYGHIGDGNLHINVMKPDAMDKAEFYRQAKEADHSMFELVRKYRGSVSAEHGIGLLKKDYLSYSRAPGELSLLRALKRTLDPNDILNPGKLIDP
jgi:FAD/FMN-containing dehydrogenase